MNEATDEGRPEVSRLLASEDHPGNNPFVAPEVPPVGATVRYHGSLTEHHGVFRVRRHIGTPVRMIELANGQRSVECRPGSVTVVLPSAQRRPNIPVRRRIHAERGMLVWYSGSVRGLHGVARVLDARPTGLTLRSGVGAGSGRDGLRFTCRYSSVSRVTVAEIGRQGSACMTCLEWVSHTVSGLKCRGCGRRVVAATMSLQDFYRNGDTVVWPGDWLPEVAYEIARKTCK